MIETLYFYMWDPMSREPILHPVCIHYVNIVRYELRNCNFFVFKLIRFYVFFYLFTSAQELQVVL
jgi:hypothetical protein